MIGHMGESRRIAAISHRPFGSRFFECIKKAAAPRAAAMLVQTCESVLVLALPTVFVFPVFLCAIAAMSGLLVSGSGCRIRGRRLVGGDYFGRRTDKPTRVDCRMLGGGLRKFMVGCRVILRGSMARLQCRLAASVRSRMVWRVSWRSCCCAQVL
jgi:hypothetical protein